MDKNEITDTSLLWEKFFEFRRNFDRTNGDIKIDRNLIEIHTGGWSENEDLMLNFKETWFYKLYLSHTSTGGHYYLDTDKNNTNANHWQITKER